MAHRYHAPSPGRPIHAWCALCGHLTTAPTQDRLHAEMRKHTPGQCQIRRYTLHRTPTTTQEASTSA